MHGNEMVAVVELWVGLALRFGARLDLASARAVPAERELTVSVACAEITFWWQKRRYRAGGGR